MQVDRMEQTTAYLASLMVYYHSPASISVAPPSSVPPFKFPPWPLTTPELPHDPTDDNELPDA